MSTDSPVCEFSRLTVPSDPLYAAVVARYAAEAARIIGFEEPMQEKISQGLQLGFPALVAYSFGPGEKAVCDVSCERIPSGIKIVLHDRGRPFDVTGPAVGRAGAPDTRITRLRDHFDEIHFNNLGPDGKEIVLIAHLRGGTLGDYEAACRPEFSDPAEASRPVLAAAPRCTVRPMRASEAPELTQLVYKTYGYSYSHDYIYYPEKIVAKNASGEVYSAVAVTDTNDIVGHCALHLWADHPRIAELAQGAVVPEFRSHGCFAKLTGHLIDAAQSRGLAGVFTEAVTAHPFSQRAALHHRLRDCALLMEVVPATVDFRGLRAAGPGRASMLVQFRYLQPVPSARRYAPVQHAEMIRSIYAHLHAGTPPRILAPPEDADGTAASRYHISLVRSLNVARIRIDCCGRDIVAAVRLKLRELCLERWDVIHLHLNLSDPKTARFCSRFEDLGFFFAGILPLAFPGGDALILQYLNNVSGRYHAIQTASRFASELVAYVKAHDPNISVEHFGGEGNSPGP